MEEFWNVVVAAIASFVLGMAVHSALGHTYGPWLRKVFHRGKRGGG
jgi:hypothetical protein